MSSQYDLYLKEHTTAVRKAWLWLIDHGLVPDNLKSCTNCYTHDVSKWSKEEYIPYDNYFNGEKNAAVKEAFDYAWLHHIHNNPHHWQYWVLINDDEGTRALRMPDRYVYEMICDWWSFSFRKGNLSEIFSWYDDHRNTIILHPDTKAMVEDILYNKIKPLLEK